MAPAGAHRMSILQKIKDGEGESEKECETQWSHV